MKSLTQTALLTAVVLLVSCGLFSVTSSSVSLLVSAQLPGDCDPSKPETCQKGQQATFHARKGGPGAGGIEDMNDLDWDNDAPRPAGMEGPDEIDVSDMSTHPIAEGPDQDFSGESVDVDLSHMEVNLTDVEKQIPATTADKKEGEDPEDPNADLDDEEADMAAFGDIFLRLELIANEYLCTTSGYALYKMESDADVWAMVAKVIANQLQNMKQNHGAQVVEQWSGSRRHNNHTCDGIPMFEESLYNHPANILMESKELLSAWLNKKDVEPSDLTDHFIPLFRTMISRWFVMRLMTYKKEESDADAAAREADPVGAANAAAGGAGGAGGGRGEDLPVIYSEEEVAQTSLLPEPIGLALLPLVIDDENPGDTCFSGGGLHSLFIRTREAGYTSSLTDSINKMLDVCYTTGKAADKPVEFARTLSGVDRFADADELYKLAVERGELCHAQQRPEELHRKDLTARPIWPAKSVPELQKIVALGKKMQEANIFAKLPFGNKTRNDPAMLSLKEGTTDIVQLYGGNNAQLRTETCALLGESLCNEFQDVINEFLDSNDAYFFTCNQTLTISFWQINGAAKSTTETGTANIVLQAFIPQETHEKTMMLQAGKEVVLIDKDEPILMDDTFENYFEVLPSEAGEEADKKNPIQLIHMQVCHPELHEKAMQVPGKKCAPAPTN